MVSDQPVPKINTSFITITKLFIDWVFDNVSTHTSALGDVLGPCDALSLSAGAGLARQLALSVLIGSWWTNHALFLFSAVERSHTAADWEITQKHTQTQTYETSSVHHIRKPKRLPEFSPHFPSVRTCPILQVSSPSVCRTARWATSYAVPENWM